MSQRYRGLALCLCLSLLALGCGAAEDETAAGGSPEEWAWLQQSQAALDGKRQELAAVRTQQRALAGGEAPVAQEEPAAEGEPAADATTPDAAAAPAATAEELATRGQQLEGEIATLSEELGGRLVGYINSLEIIQGEPLTPEQQQAMRMKSEEDVELAREWIEKGGDYRRAIEIYEGALLWDPDNEKLAQALAEAQEMRFMTEERFAQVEKGMTQEQVRGILGPVNLHNVREYGEEEADQKVVWLYPKEDRSAASVWFDRDSQTGVFEVYQTDFEMREEEDAGES